MQAAFTALALLLRDLSRIETGFDFARFTVSFSRIVFNNDELASVQKGYCFKQLLLCVSISSASLIM